MRTECQGAVPLKALRFEVDRPTLGRGASVEVTTQSANGSIELWPALFLRDAEMEVIVHAMQHRCPSGLWGVRERLRTQTYEKTDAGHYELRNTTTATCQLPIATMRATHSESGLLLLRSPDTLMLREWQDTQGVEAAIIGRKGENSDVAH